MSGLERRRLVFDHGRRHSGPQHGVVSQCWILKTVMREMLGIMMSALLAACRRLVGWVTLTHRDELSHICLLGQKLLLLLLLLLGLLLSLLLLQLPPTLLLLGLHHQVLRRPVLIRVVGCLELHLCHCRVP